MGSIFKRAREYTHLWCDGEGEHGCPAAACLLSCLCSRSYAFFLYQQESILLAITQIPSPIHPVKLSKLLLFLNAKSSRENACRLPGSIVRKSCLYRLSILAISSRSTCSTRSRRVRRCDTIKLSLLLLLFLARDDNRFGSMTC